MPDFPGKDLLSRIPLPKRDRKALSKVAILGNAGAKLDALLDEAEQLIAPETTTPTPPGPAVKKVIESVGFAPTIFHKAILDFGFGGARKVNPAGAEKPLAPLPPGAQSDLIAVPGESVQVEDRFGRKLKLPAVLPNPNRGVPAAELPNTEQPARLPGDQEQPGHTLLVRFVDP